MRWENQSTPRPQWKTSEQKREPTNSTHIEIRVQNRTQAKLVFSIPRQPCSERANKYTQTYTKRQILLNTSNNSFPSIHSIRLRGHLARVSSSNDNSDAKTHKLRQPSIESLQLCYIFIWKEKQQKLSELRWLSYEDTRNNLWSKSNWPKVTRRGKLTISVMKD